MKRWLIFIIVFYTVANISAQKKSGPLFYLEKRHCFSSVNHEDTFKLTVRGKNIIDSYVIFQIIDYRGREIYHDRFTMGELCEFGPLETDKAYRRNSADSAIIIKLLSQFFDEDRFEKPAIADTVEMESNSIPKEIWWDISQDRTAIGFYYQLGAEDGRGIVYSKKKKKVIQYYACC